MAVTAFRPIPFSDLVDGKHTVQVQLVDDAGQPLTPDASDSVTFQIQFAPIVDINPYLQITQIILAGAIVFVLFYRGWGRNLLATLSGRVGRKNARGRRSQMQCPIHCRVGVRSRSRSSPSPSCWSFRFRARPRRRWPRPSPTSYP